MPDATSITLYDGASNLGTSSVDGSGNWSKSATLSAGDHSLKATAIDSAGNTSGYSAIVNLKSGDSTAPNVPDLLDDSGSSSTDNITNDSTPRVQFAVSLTGPNSVMPPDGAVKQLILEQEKSGAGYSEVSNIATASLTITSSGSTKNWIYTHTNSTMPNGGWNFRAKWRDSNNAYSGYGSVLAMTIDTTAPSSPAITSHTNGYVFTGTSFTISGTAS